MSRRLVAFPVCVGLAAAPAAAAPAPIVVSSPAAGATVSSSARIAGTADVFEAVFRLDVRAHGKLVSSRTVHASSGTGTRGRWAVTVRLPRGDVTLVAYEDSAKDGSHIHVVRVPLHVR